MNHVKFNNKQKIKIKISHVNLLLTLNQLNLLLPVPLLHVFWFCLHIIISRSYNENHSVKVKVVHHSSLVLDAHSMPKDEEYEKGCVKGNMVYKIHWTDPPKLMAVESMCGHIPQVSILDTKEVTVA